MESKCPDDTAHMQDGVSPHILRMLEDFFFRLTLPINKSNIYESAHNKTYKMAHAPSEDLDQPGHPPSLISLCCALNGELRTQAFFMRTARLCSDWADAQADLSFLGAHSILNALAQMR